MATLEDGHVYVSELEPGPVHAILRVQEARSLKTRNGKPYLALTLSDNSGRIPAKRWDAADSDTELFRPGAIVEFQGDVELYRNNPQIIIRKARQADPEDIFEDAFETRLDFDPDDLLAEVVAMLQGLSDDDLRRIAQAYLDDEEFMTRFRAGPGAKAMHHPYPSGLLEHVHSVMGLGAKLCDHYDWLDRDMVLLGLFLHDSGKVVELDGGEVTNYSIQGELLGHITIGINLLDRKLVELGDIPERKAVMLKHIILSHHGLMEWGSPKPPMTPEAQVVHTIEMLDARMNAFLREQAEAPEHTDELGGVRWSNLLKRKIITRQPPSDDE